jgi:DNA helicase TIP49 (TBP-interacting protein)
MGGCCVLQVEGIGVDEESLAYLGEIGDRTSLRHAVQLLTPASIMAKTNGRDHIAKVDTETFRCHPTHCLFFENELGERARVSGS